MSEQTPEQEQTPGQGTTAEPAVDEVNLAAPGMEYPYLDQTKEPGAEEILYTSEASHSLLNPAFYPKDTKPEAAWSEAEKNDGAESPNDLTVPSAPGTDEEVPLGEEFSEEAAQARTKEYEAMAQKDIEEGSPVASSDPDKARSAEEGEQAVKSGKGKIARRRSN